MPDVDPLVDRRDHHGPFDVIGDVHGCLRELVALLGGLGWSVEVDDDGRAVDARHPGGRTAVFVGDLVDRGPDSPGVLRLVMAMVRGGTALCVEGNHENKLRRALGGADVTTGHGLAQTLEALAAESAAFRDEVVAFLGDLPPHLVLDDGRLVVAHAGLHAHDHGVVTRRTRAFALYGDVDGTRDEHGLPVRRDWAQEYAGEAVVVHGHTPRLRAEWTGAVLCVDTGVPFGGALTAVRWPERTLAAVPAERQWCPPSRPLA